jgi:acyl dehydratase
MSAWPNGAPRAGDTASMSRTIEANDIVRFTELSGDRNPVHYDAQVAGGRGPGHP